MKTWFVLLAVLIGASAAHAQALTGNDVSFMNFKTVDPAAICSRLPGTSQETLANLKKFAKFESLHNARGGAENAKKILTCLDASGLVRQLPKGAAASAIRTSQLR